jgi:hypothetical protein
LREFIVGDMLGAHLKVKRLEFGDLWRGSSLEIDEKLKMWDTAAEEMLRVQRVPDVEHWMEVLKQLKVEAAKWVGKEKSNKLYGEFKVTLAAALNAS